VVVHCRPARCRGVSRVRQSRAPPGRLSRPARAVAQAGGAVRIGAATDSTIASNRPVAQMEIS
jgi:hypothetical protein